MKNLPWFRFFPEKFLAETLHLSKKRRMACLELWILIWMSPEGKIHNSDEWLANKLCETCEEILTTYRPIINEMFKCSKRWISSPYLSEERDHAIGVSKQNSENAKKRIHNKKHASDGMPDRDTVEDDLSDIHTIATHNNSTGSMSQNRDSLLSNGSNFGTTTSLLSANGITAIRRELPCVDVYAEEQVFKGWLDDGNQWPAIGKAYDKACLTFLRKRYENQ